MTLVHILQSTFSSNAQQRYSGLKAPAMSLQSCHTSEILSVRFNPDGETLATCGTDKAICIWNVYNDCECVMYIKNAHIYAVLDVAWSIARDSIFTCSADKTIAHFDIITGEWLQTFSGHRSQVNSIFPTLRNPAMLASVGDDGSVKFFDIRSKKCVSTFNMKYPQTTVVVLEDGFTLYCGGIDNIIHNIDLRNNEGEVGSLFGHQDTITGLAVSPSGTWLASNGMDHKVKIWDIRPFAVGDRCKKTLSGHQHNAEKQLIKVAWSPNERYVCSGSADHNVYIWNTSPLTSSSTTSSSSLMSLGVPGSEQTVNAQAKRTSVSSLSSNTSFSPYVLKGHLGTVIGVDFHPSEPIVASSSTDKTVILSEMESY